VRIRGPLGLGRVARTQVVEVEAYSRLAGTAEVGSRTLARVSWTISPDGVGTRVRLAARMERATLRDRLLLRVGGATWMRRRFAGILASLDRRL
jgi:hypothetical protein